MRTPEAPLFNDPIYNGAADPTVIWNRGEKQWWLLYTQRPATLPGPGVSNVHGSDIGIASSPDGHDWLYRGVCNLAPYEPGRNSYWAPEVLYHGGLYHMYVSYVRGMPSTWDRPRHMLHYTSRDMWSWDLASRVGLDSERVIDACVAEPEPGLWRMWYKDESDESQTHFADSTDLYNWTPRGRAFTFDSNEGPNVFRWRGTWWLICDMWRGQACFSSGDCLSWSPAGTILDKPGSRPGDKSIGSHADVVVSGDDAFIFYFSHDPGSMHTNVQVARLDTDGSNLTCDRDATYEFKI